MLNDIGILEHGETLLRLILAMTGGALIGLNRFLRQKAAGLRTHGLVALGTAVATLLIIATPGNDAQAVSRVIQGLVTGVGFIGAGVIMRGNSSNRVHGLTTAAAIWASAIVGIACALGAYVIGGAAVLLALSLLLLGRPVERGAARLLGSRAAEREEDD
jgi:putative Mg2+ transporter-C (MgtC) family protein